MWFCGLKGLFWATCPALHASQSAGQRSCYMPSLLPHQATPAGRRGGPCSLGCPACRRPCPASRAHAHSARWWVGTCAALRCAGGAALFLACWLLCNCFSAVRCLVKSLVKDCSMHSSRTQPPPYRGSCRRPANHLKRALPLSCVPTAVPPSSPPCSCRLPACSAGLRGGSPLLPGT